MGFFSHVPIQSVDRLGWRWEPLSLDHGELEVRRLLPAPEVCGSQCLISATLLHVGENRGCIIFILKIGKWASLSVSHRSRLIARHLLARRP